MRAVVIHDKGDVRVEDVAEPRVVQPTDALVRVVAAAVCGSDIAVLRGLSPLPRPVQSGHEFVGIVEDVGSDVTTVRPGQFVIAPFNTSDGDCANCRRGLPIACENGRLFGEFGPDGSALEGGQAEFVRVPLADTTLVVAPAPSEALLPAVLTLTDVMATGHEATMHADVRPGVAVVIVGDGAVGQCAILACRRLGAERIVVMSRDPRRQLLARRHGATDVVTARGDEGVAEIVDLLDGGSGHVIEAVGSLDSMRQAIGCARPGGRIGYMGLPWGVELPLWELFGKNLSLSGGGANVRAVVPELLPEVLDGRLDPSGVLDASFSLESAPQAFQAMDTRQCVKAVLRP
ncbi:threonine dehydrogenase-like Zn-dependent dehydrogenase [Kibdelosporangium banguiense]|uniref:Threonine dehydrogenase-like Zn-dependent dehydrogenase n=1 Tax=Kibdelosporangium banguiense TaxID=1365924 RepID=A0ABS4U1N8_9PSEU|nr:alcohol dehydrogenase catalytic domain-containing protein [Kibdelosporangium banguiense]MBP2330567.1 threonine dehydrogenase-like Zn-dependent dehydrogenase [Kibdelosporangium banguiense]